MRHRGGFTLIEVMVALAIVAVTLAAGLRAAGALTDNAERLSSVLEAQWCAENYLTRQTLQRVFPGTGESEFPCEQMGRNYVGRVMVQPMGINPDQRQVIVSMFSEGGVPLVQIVDVASRQ